MSGVLDFSQLNVGASMDFVWIAVVIVVCMVFFGILVSIFMSFMSYNIEVIIKRQLGDPIIDENGRKTFPTDSTNSVGKIYNRKVGPSSYKEYFKIKGTSFDYQNFFPDHAFYQRKRGFFDIKGKGIELLLTQDRGLIPLSVSNPGLSASSVQIGEVISAISDSLKERDELYNDDFWAKYGQIITLSVLIGFFIIGMMMLIKYQEVFWENSIAQLQNVLNTLKDTARPVIPGG